MDSTFNKPKDESKEKTESDLNNISIKDNDSNNNITSISNHYNDFFENFKQNMQILLMQWKKLGLVLFSQL